MSLPVPVQHAIDEIRNNRTSGAAELTSRAADVLALAAEVTPGAVEEVARLLVAAQPAMAPLVNLARSAQAPREFVLRMRAAAPRVAAHAARLIRDGSVVLTHSYSSTVLEALRAAHAAGTRFRVICTESRPLCEGATLAASLGREGIPAALIVDAAMASFLPQTSLVLVGADAISLRGLVNKTGTALLALAASKFGVPIYALASSEKFFPLDYDPPPQALRDPREILDPPVPNVEAVNYYFDLTPLDSLAGIVTEGGIISQPPAP
jgi:translation initiation factor 2B subunit (eIF-2B alpha/beta/delta family)